MISAETLVSSVRRSTCSLSRAYSGDSRLPPRAREGKLPLSLGWSMYCLMKKLTFTSRISPSSWLTRVRLPIAFWS